MKPATVLCSAILILLTACGGRASADPTPAATPHSAPIALSSGSTAPVPCSLTPDQLPREPVESLVEVWNGEPACLLAQLPQEDIALYGLYSEDKSQSLVQRYGEELTAYELPWLGPRCIPPQLFSGDYDGDGDRETLVLTYTGSGTGVSSWTLTLLERTEEGWEAVTLPDASYQEDLSPLLACRWLEGTAVLSLGEISLPLPALSEYVEVGERWSLSPERFCTMRRKGTVSPRSWTWAYSARRMPPLITAPGWRGGWSMTGKVFPSRNPGSPLWRNELDKRL